MFALRWINRVFVRQKKHDVGKLYRSGLEDTVVQALSVYICTLEEGHILRVLGLKHPVVLNEQLGISSNANPATTAVDAVEGKQLQLLILINLTLLRMYASDTCCVDRIGYLQN